MSLLSLETFPRKEMPRHETEYKRGFANRSVSPFDHFLRNMSWQLADGLLATKFLFNRVKAFARNSKLELLSVNRVFLFFNSYSYYFYDYCFVINSNIISLNSL